MPRTKAEKLDDSINVPVPQALKRRVLEMAGKEPGEPAYTKFARLLLREGVERREKKLTAIK